MRDPTGQEYTPEERERLAVEYKDEYDIFFHPLVKYRVVSSSSVKLLEAAVQEGLCRGWRLVGGAGCGNDAYAQAMENMQKEGSTE